MLEKTIDVLKILEERGFSAYIVGGYVRDTLIGKKSLDIDVCTSATPKDIVEIFQMKAIPDKEYGSVVLNYQGVKIDITTYRKEIKYEDNRKPVKIKYIKDIKTDLKRRDFTINTFCMNSNQVIMDILDVKKDLDNKIIRTVGNPRYRIKEDALRILRAIRFATILDFKIDNKTKKYIAKYGYLLGKLSFNRKKEELDKIFTSINRKVGCDLILELKLDKYLNIDRLSNVTLCDNLIGIWSQLEVDSIYPFSKLERVQMVRIRELMNLNIYDPYIIYKYGLYLTMIVCDIKNGDKKILNEIRNNLIITDTKDIAITPQEIFKILNKKPGSYLKEIISDLEELLLHKKLDNNYESIKEYIIKKYL